MTGVEIRIDPVPTREAYESLYRAARGKSAIARLPRWELSLVHLGAYLDERLVGYVNVATDGGVHAFLLDPMVHPDQRRVGLGRRLVAQATDLARERGAQWLHVDYEPDLAGFYRACGFAPTLAGLIRLGGN